MSRRMHRDILEGGSTAPSTSQRDGSYCTSLGATELTQPTTSPDTTGLRRPRGALPCLGRCGLWEGPSVWLLCPLDSSSRPRASLHSLLPQLPSALSQGLYAGIQAGFSPVKSAFPHRDALVLSRFPVPVLPLKLVFLSVWSLHQPVGRDCLKLYLGSSFCLPNCPLSLSIIRTQLQYHFLQEDSLGGSCPADCPPTGFFLSWQPSPDLACLRSRWVFSAPSWAHRRGSGNAWCVLGQAQGGNAGRY